jgi:hypothetical protein
MKNNTKSKTTEEKAIKTVTKPQLTPKAKIFTNPANVGVSINELERFLRPFNDAENTNIFYEAVMKDYILSNSKEVKKIEPILPNAIELWEDWDNKKEVVLSVIAKNTNISEEDIRCLGFVFDAVSELRNNSGENDLTDNEICVNHFHNFCKEIKFHINKCDGKNKECPFFCQLKNINKL